MCVLGGGSLHTNTHEKGKLEIKKIGSTHIPLLIQMFPFRADAGKSTTGGQILFLSGQVDDRTIQKYEKEAKDKSRESWCVFI
jgi:peptide chain release factor subunit 3